MLETIKQLFCFHTWKPKRLFYTEAKDGNFVYIIVLYSYNKCKKCNKEQSREITRFSCCFTDERDTIISLLERHGAISYLKFLQEQIQQGS